MLRMCLKLWHCIQHNEDSMYAGPTKAITGSVLNKSQARKWGTYLCQGVSLPIGHVMTADCWDDIYIKKQFRRQNAVGNMLVRKFSFAPTEAKIQLFKSYCYPIYGCALGVILTRTLLENLLSVILTHSNDLLLSPPIHQLESGICDERNWPYQCVFPRISLQRDEQSNSFPQQYYYCHCQYGCISTVCTDG